MRTRAMIVFGKHDLKLTQSKNKLFQFLYYLIGVHQSTYLDVIFLRNSYLTIFFSYMTKKQSLRVYVMCLPVASFHIFMQCSGAKRLTKGKVSCPNKISALGQTVNVPTLNGEFCKFYLQSQAWKAHRSKINNEVGWNCNIT